MTDIINARKPLQNLKYIRNSTLPILKWNDEWNNILGDGITIGLIDTGFTSTHPDLVGANITARNFVSTTTFESWHLEHGTHSATTLVGQGVSQILGIAPRAKLLVAVVLGVGNVAKAEDIVQALKWLIMSNVTVIAIPFGDSTTYLSIAEALYNAKQKGIPVFAAAGNSYPRSLLFPASVASTIAVGAIDLTGQLLLSCCRFPRLDIVAPGYEIIAPISLRQTKACTGSSIACVLAASAASLVISMNTKLNIHKQNELIEQLCGIN